MSELDPIRISWSALKLLSECALCFYRATVPEPEQRIEQPDIGGGAFVLSTTVDRLLKREFDIYRTNQKQHPSFRSHKKLRRYILPYQHDKLKSWRDGKGVEWKIPNSGIILTGKIDDLWFDTKTQEVIVVEYKTTSSESPVEIHKDQIRVYQWLLRREGLNVSNEAYLVYCKVNTKETRFNRRLRFGISLHDVNIKQDNWVEDRLLKIKRMIMGGHVPDANDECKFCNYVKSVAEHNLSAKAARVD